MPAKMGRAAPAVGRRRKLRVLGTFISLLEEVRVRASADLGFDIAFEVLDFPACQRKAALAPESFDVYDQTFANLSIVWHWGALQPLDTRLLKRWDTVGPLSKLGGVDKYANRGVGDAPASKLYVQPDHSLGPEPTRHIAMLPTVHQFDSFGYDARIFNGEASRLRESWAMLFDSRARGRLALVDEPAIGLFDAALAAEALGVVHFDRIDNMSPAELTKLFEFLRSKCDEGFFLPCWTTSQEAADRFRSGEAAIQSMWSPAYTELGAAENVREAAPAEGYRAWHGGMSLARHVAGAELQMAYEYMDWWLSGWAGAVMARQGYYISAPAEAKAHLKPAEWAYWYDGQEASEDLMGVDNQTLVVRRGARRSGGGYLERARRIAVWNTVMDEHNYASRLWSRFVADVKRRRR